MSRDIHDGSLSVANRLQAMTPFVYCCEKPHLHQVEPQYAHQTVESGILRLAKPPLAMCSSCGQAVTACPRCDRSFQSVTSLADWQNHYSQFAKYDADTTLQRAHRLLGKNFPLRPLKDGHYFYTLWQGVCKGHPQSYIWLQERPAKSS